MDSEIPDIETGEGTLEDSEQPEDGIPESERTTDIEELTSPVTDCEQPEAGQILQLAGSDASEETHQIPPDLYFRKKIASLLDRKGISEKSRLIMNLPLNITNKPKTSDKGVEPLELDLDEFVTKK
jgi:hypothetical protein